MYKENTINISTVPEDAPLIAPSSVRQDLPRLIRNMKLSRTWAGGDLNSMILLKGSGKNVVLLALHEGTEIVSYQENDSITFQIIEGSLKFNTRSTTAALGMGQVLTLSDKVRYRLTASEETVLLLSIAKDSTRNAVAR